MNKDVFSGLMTPIIGAFERGDFRNSLNLSRQLKESILAEDDHNGEQLGWAHFYEFKSCFMLEDYKSAYNLMVTPLPKIFAVDVENAAYMCSVAAEIALHLRLPEDIVRFSNRCIELRLEARNTVDALRCAKQSCIYLETLKRNDLNRNFAQYQIDEGLRWDDAAPFAHGCRWLILNAEATHDRDIISYLYNILVRSPLMPDKGTDGIPPDFSEVTTRLFESAWFRGLQESL
jgi:hypothetical protein